MPYTCSKCGRSFSFAQNRWRHMRTVHKTPTAATVFSESDIVDDDKTERSSDSGGSSESSGSTSSFHGVVNYLEAKKNAKTPEEKMRVRKVGKRGNNYYFLRFICDLSHRKRAKLLRVASHSLITEILRVIRNILSGKLPLDSADKQELDRHRHSLRRLRNDDYSFNYKRYLLEKHNGFLPIICRLIRQKELKNKNPLISKTIADL